MCFYLKRDASSAMNLENHNLTLKQNYSEIKIKNIVKIQKGFEVFNITSPASFFPTQIFSFSSKLSCTSNVSPTRSLFSSFFLSTVLSSWHLSTIDPDNRTDGRRHKEKQEKKVRLWHHRQYSRFTDCVYFVFLKVWAVEWNWNAQNECLNNLAKENVARTKLSESKYLTKSLWTDDTSKIWFRKCLIKFLHGKSLSVFDREKGT